MATQAFIRQSGIADNAGFRSLGLQISQAFEAVGFIKTADTGQIDWATVLKPTSGATMAGFEIRQLPASALQTANPVLVKISYGTSNQSQFVMGFTMQVGHTTDGAGTFTGIAGTIISCYSYDNNATGNMNFISCDADHFSMALFLGIAGTTSNYYCIFTVDRLRDETGTALDTGVNVFVLGNTVPQQCILLAGAGAQFPTTPLTTPMCLMPPGANTNTTMGANINFSYVYPYLGYTGNPDMNLIIYPGNAISVPGGTIMSFPMYGVEHTYVLCGSFTSYLGSNGSANWSIGVRYE